MITYRVIEENLQNSEFGSYVAYGISVCDEDIILNYISDVFTEKERAEKLVKLCNKNGLDPIHLREVVEDTIG